MKLSELTILELCALRDAVSCNVSELDHKLDMWRASGSSCSEIEENIIDRVTFLKRLYVELCHEQDRRRP